MPSASSLLLIAAVLGAWDPAPPSDVDAQAPEGQIAVVTPPAEAPTEGGVDWTPAEEPQDDSLARGPGDPLYDRLFNEPSPPTKQTGSPPSLPAWVWVASAAGLAGLFFWTKRRAGEAKVAQVEILGHTRVGPKARLTVVRVAGEDGRMRRLLVSTGEGSPALLADLGIEGTPAATVDTAPQAQSAPFGQSLAEKMSEETELDDAAVASEDLAGPGAVPPPRVPVWNETPSEYRNSAREEEPVAASPSPSMATPPRERSVLDDLEQMLGAEDAPEAVFDVRWDPDDGWHGLPDGAEPPVGPTHDDAESIDDVEPASPTRGMEGTASTRAAFQTLLSGTGSASRRVRREPLAEPRIVKPLRPRSAAPVRRTPYDAALPTQAALPEASASRPTPRTSAEVQDLVAEVLRERTSNAAAPEGRVVELARWARRGVGR